MVIQGRIACTSPALIALYCCWKLRAACLVFTAAKASKPSTRSNRKQSRPNLARSLREYNNFYWLFLLLQALPCIIVIYFRELFRFPFSRAACGGGQKRKPQGTPLITCPPAGRTLHPFSYPSHMTSRRCKPRKPMVSRHCGDGSSSRRPGNCWSNSPIATWPSRRASGAPKQ